MKNEGIPQRQTLGTRQVGCGVTHRLRLQNRARARGRLMHGEGSCDRVGHSTLLSRDPGFASETHDFQVNLPSRRAPAPGPAPTSGGRVGRAETTRPLSLRGLAWGDLAAPMVRPDPGMVDSLDNSRDDVSHFAEDLLVSYAQHFQAFEVQGKRSSLVFRSLQVMDVAVHLDHQPSGIAVGIDDPSTDHRLRTHSRTNGPCRVALPRVLALRASSHAAIRGRVRSCRGKRRTSHRVRVVVPCAGSRSGAREVARVEVFPASHAPTRGAGPGVGARVETVNQGF